MNDSIDIWFKLAIASLATWRVTHLLAYEDGPFLAMARLRRAVDAHWWGQMFDCFKCLSLWVAAPMAIWVGANGLQWLMSWLAVSGAACLCDRLGQPEVVMQTLPDNQANGEQDGDQYELLRKIS